MNKLKSASTLKLLGSVCGLIAMLLVSACESGVDRGYAEKKDPWSGSGPKFSKDKPSEGEMSIFGSGGLLGGDKKESGDGIGIGVNVFLWRASLDTISFMPLLSADAFGGVILTDWHTPAETPNERFKINLYILGRALRADGLKVATFRQVRNPNGDWVDATVDSKVARDIENAVLTRARQLRADAIASQ